LPTTPQRVALRSKIVLQAIAGVANQVIAATLGVTRPTVLLWRRRFTAGGPSALLRDRPRGGGVPRLSAGTVQEVVEATLHTKPPAATHWTVRTMARARGISPASVAAHLGRPRSQQTSLGADVQSRSRPSMSSRARSSANVCPAIGIRSFSSSCGASTGRRPRTSTST